MIEMIASTDITKVARGIDLPILAISGRQDPLFPQDQLALIAESFRDSACCLMDRCGHNPH